MAVLKIVIFLYPLAFDVPVSAFPVRVLPSSLMWKNYTVSQKQEAQLSQRDCAMLGVIDYFAKSLKIIRNDILEKGVNLYQYFSTFSEIFSVK